MTNTYKKTYVSEKTFQISKHLVNKDKKNIILVGGTEIEVLDLIITNILVANGSYFVWDPDGSIYEKTADKMKEKGYSIFNVNSSDDDNDCYSFIDFFVYNPKLFLESLSVIYVHESDVSQLSSLIKYLMDEEYHALYGQRLTILIGCLENARLEPEFAWYLKKCDENRISVMLHSDTLLPNCFTPEVGLKILKSCSYNIFLDNKCDASITYLNTILPVFASCKDINLNDWRDNPQIDLSTYLSSAADVKVLEGFRDMGNEDCLIVENGNTFVFDNKKTLSCYTETSAKLKKNDVVSHEDGLDLKKNIVPVTLAAICGCIVFYALRKKKK